MFASLSFGEVCDFSHFQGAWRGEWDAGALPFFACAFVWVALEGAAILIGAGLLDTI
jgi:hypothetical protein